MMRAISECVGELIKRYSAGKADIDVRKIKNTIAARVGINRSPKLVDIIAAVPEEWKKRLLPILTAKPIRSASGISVVAVMSKPHRSRGIERERRMGDGWAPWNIDSFGC